MPHEDIFRRRPSVIILSVTSDKKPDLNRLKQKREHAGQCTQAVQGRCAGGWGWLQVSLYSSLKSYNPGPAVSFSQVCLLHSELPLCKMVANRSQGKELLGSNTEGKRDLWLGTPRQSLTALIVSDWTKSLPLNQSYGQCCLIC